MRGGRGGPAAWSCLTSIASCTSAGAPWSTAATPAKSSARRRAVLKLGMSCSMRIISSTWPLPESAMSRFLNMIDAAAFEEAYGQEWC